MTPPDPRDPFTASDEAFFEAGLAPAREVMSERPVTLDAEEPLAEEPSASTARDARRGRFVRPVRSTLIALSVLATVGLVRHVWRGEAAELAASAPTLVPLTTNAAPAAELVTDLVPTEEDGATLLLTSMCDGNPSSTSLEAPSAAAADAALFGPPAPPDMPPAARPAHRLADHAKTKPLTRGPSQHSARPRPLRRSAPVTKAALLHALRSS